MYTYNVDSLMAMLGNVDQKLIYSASSCISQCTGCMCSCRCSCSGGKNVLDVEWEDLL